MTTQNGTWKPPSEIALRIKQHGDDAHGLLGVIAAVPERIKRSGDELRAPERAVDRVGREPHKRQDTISINSSASMKPDSGEPTIANVVLMTPSQTMALMPALARPAPIKPPIKACELDDGMP